MDKVAIIDLGGERVARELTYAWLDSMANAIRALTRRGFARGDRVAILSVNRAEYLASYFGIMRAGFIAVPVNFKFPQGTIHFILRDAGAKLLFCDKARANDAPDGLPRVQFGDSGPGGFDRFLEPGAFRAVVPDPREPAMFLYTSGSTGAPKGVVLSHQSHIWVVETRLAPDLDRHRYLVAAPLYHMNALALCKLACAAHATIVQLPQFSARAYIEAIAHYRCNWLTAVPPMMAMMLREKRACSAVPMLASVACVRMGSGAGQLSSRDRRRSMMHAAAGVGDQRVRHHRGRAGRVRAASAEGLPLPETSVGYPAPARSRLRLDRRPATSDADEGVLEMRCPAVMNGYHNRPDAQAAVHRGRLLHHRRRVPAGRATAFHLLRRGAPTTCSCRAGRTSTRPTSSACWSAIPTLPRRPWCRLTDEIKGQKPVAFVVPRRGQMPSAEEVKRFALANAPAYAHPRYVWFVDELPLASTNKLDRNLRRLARSAPAAASKHRRALPGLAPRVGFARLAALRGAGLGRARGPVRSVPLVNEGRV